MEKTKGIITCRFKIEPFEHDFMNLCKGMGFIVEDINHDLYAKDIGQLRLVLSGTYYWAFVVNERIVRKCCRKFMEKGNKIHLYEFLKVEEGRSLFRSILEEKEEKKIIKLKIKPKPIKREVVKIKTKINPWK